MTIQPAVEGPLKISQYLGINNRSACPHCGNSVQNGVPDGSPRVRRCASCKHVFRAHAEELIADLEAQLAEATRKCDGIVANYTADLRRLNAEIHRQRDLLRGMSGDYWGWQGDGSDNLESITCPIVILPRDLRTLIRPLLNEADRAVIENAKSSVRSHKFVNHYPTRLISDLVSIVERQIVER
jgi:hypothetical protein